MAHSYKFIQIGELIKCVCFSKNQKTNLYDLSISLNMYELPFDLVEGSNSNYIIYIIGFFSLEIQRFVNSC